MRLQWSADALSDLQAISEHIERDRGLQTANRITRSIYDAVRSLRKFPHRGRFGNIENVREFVIPDSPWIAVYSISADRIMVLNIVHGAQLRPEPPYFFPN